MVNRWIWQEPDWPNFYWDAPRLAPVLHGAHTKRLELQQLLKQLAAAAGIRPAAHERQAGRLGEPAAHRQQPPNNTVEPGNPACLAQLVVRHRP